MFRLHIILFEDIRRSMHLKKLILPLLLFVLPPVPFIIIYYIMMYLNSAAYPIPMGIFTFSFAVYTIQQLHIILSFFILGTIVWPVYSIIEGGSNFSPMVKDGTIKMIVSQPVRRVEIYLSKLLKFIIPISIFTFLSLLIQDLLISILFGGSILPFLYLFRELLLLWLIIFLLQMMIYSLTTAINALTFSTLFSTIFGIAYFIAFPLVFSFSGHLIPIIVLYNSDLDDILVIILLNILYGINPGYYTYSLLYQGYQILYNIPTLLTKSLLAGIFPFYPANFQDSLVIITGIFIIPTILGCLGMSRKNFQD